MKTGQKLTVLMRHGGIFFFKERDRENQKEKREREIQGSEFARLNQPMFQTQMNTLPIETNKSSPILRFAQTKRSSFILFFLQMSVRNKGHEER